MKAELKGKKVLVIGSGLSGVGSVRLLNQVGAKPVVLEENTKVTKEDIEKKLEEMAKMYGMKLEEIKDIIPETEKENIKKDVAIGKAVDFIMENAKEKAAKKSTAKKSTAKKDDDAEKKTTAKKSTTKKTTTKSTTAKKTSTKKTTTKKEDK